MVERNLAKVESRVRNRVTRLRFFFSCFFFFLKRILWPTHPYLVKLSFLLSIGQE